MLEQEVFPAIRRKRSESQRETNIRRTRSQTINEPMITEQIPQTVVDNTTKPRKRIPRELSLLDNIEPYNIWDDLVNIKANVNMRQMMQFRLQQQKLLQEMRRPKLEGNAAFTSTPEEEERTMALRYHIKIKKNPVLLSLTHKLQ